MSKYLFIRMLRAVDHAVFCVAEGQKTYWNPTSRTKQAYSSGQQVKRSFINALLDELDEVYAPVTITQVLKTSSGKRTLGDGEPLSAIDPHFVDQLIGGWMRAQAGKQTIKRRSPLSISAMRPIHPYLSSLAEESITFDRTGTSGDHKVIVRDEKGVPVSDETLQEFLQSSGESLRLRTFMPSEKVGYRATGLFVTDFAIDLSRLFSIGLNPYDLEIEQNMVTQLQDEGWIKNGNSIICPDKRRGQIITALAKSLISWRITSNQSRTYSPQETIAISIGTNASLVSASIRGELDEEGERKANVVIDRDMEGDNLRLFVSPSARGFIQGIHAESDALLKAEKHIKEKLTKYPYE